MEVQDFLDQHPLENVATTTRYYYMLRGYFTGNTLPYNWQEKMVKDYPIVFLRYMNSLTPDRKLRFLKVVIRFHPTLHLRLLRFLDKAKRDEWDYYHETIKK